MARQRVTGVGAEGWHRQARVDAPDGPVDVDVRIAPLLRHLWERGYRTHLSCQSARNSGWAWIRFATDAQAAAFVALVDPARLPATMPAVPSGVGARDVTFRNAPSLRPDRLLIDDTSRHG